MARQEVDLRRRWNDRTNFKHGEKPEQTVRNVPRTWKGEKPRPKAKRSTPRGHITLRVKVSNDHRTNIASRQLGFKPKIACREIFGTVAYRTVA